MGNYQLQGRHPGPLSCYDGKMMRSLNKKINSVACGTVLSPASWIMNRLFLLILAAMLFSLSIAEKCRSQEDTLISRPDVPAVTKLVQAVMCEDIKDGRPINHGIVFSSGLGKVSCYTEFDPVVEKTTIYHCWYFKNNLSAKKYPLDLRPPSWSTYSQIQLRETDKGPWRVEIVDQDGNIFQTLRFSITD